MRQGTIIEKVLIAGINIRNKEKGIKQIEYKITKMLNAAIKTVNNIICAIKNHDLDALVKNNKLEETLTSWYYDLLEQVNYCMTAYSVMARNYRRCIGAIYLSSDILHLIRRINLIVILSTKAICDVGNLPHIIVLLESVVKKIRHFARVYETRNQEQITAYIHAQTTFRRKWHKQRDLLVKLLKEQVTGKGTSQILNILTIIHEIRSMAYITITMYERLLYIERGKIYHLSNDNF